MLTSAGHSPICWRTTGGTAPSTTRPAPPATLRVWRAGGCGPPTTWRPRGEQGIEAAALGRIRERQQLMIQYRGHLLACTTDELSRYGSRLTVERDQSAVEGSLR